MTTKNLLRVGSHVAERGTVVKDRIHVGNYADGSRIEIPIILVNGSYDGPTLYVEAVQHGPELTGVVALHNVLASIDPNVLHGRIIAVPVANPPAFAHRTRQSPLDGEDMNRKWPGRGVGSLTERIAFVLWEEAIRQSDVVVDLHTWDWTTVNHTRMGDERSAELARVFGTPVLVREKMDSGFKRAGYAGKLRIVAMEAGKAAITPELGGARRLKKHAVAMGEKGIRNILCYLGMISGKPELPPVQVVVSWESSNEIRATAGGLFLSEVEPGQRVTEGAILGRIVDPGHFHVLEEIRSPQPGLVVSYTENPVVHTGDVVVIVVPILEELYNDVKMT